ncbi:MAG: 50S ribosomal protein L25 [Bdellovibrionaceae bacterium]|jgi:large subunit ribosomal protein L25|nr:50S ribosomal protein L25 [Pseudobdellovibrionaceae bacterium]
MQKTIEISAIPRNIGKGNSKAYRVDKKIPGVIYGPSLKGNLNMCISQLEAERYTGSKAYENAMFEIKSEDKALNGLRVIIKSVSRAVATHRAQHIDFYAPDMNKTIRVNIELKFEGKPKGVKDGGLFNIIRREVEIECLPTDIPESFIVNTDNVELNQALHVSDIGIDSKYKVMTAENITIANVTVVEEEAEVVAPVAAATEVAPAAAPEKK